MERLPGILENLKKHDELDETRLVESLRELRAVACCEEVQQKFRDSVEILVNILDSRFDAKLPFSIGVQCLINLTVNNQPAKEHIWTFYASNIKKWSHIQDLKAKNYIFALYHNIIYENDKLIKELIEDSDQLSLLIDSKEIEFAQFLLERCIKIDFQKMYSLLKNDDQIFLLQLLDSLMEKNDFSNEIQYLSEQFKLKSDGLLRIKPEFVEKINILELTSILNLLSRATCVEKYKILLQKDKSLAISCMYILIGIHATDEKLDSKLKVAVAVDKLVSGTEGSSPDYNFKSFLIQVIGNLSFKNKEIQDLCRETDCLPVILECCTVDAKNPFIREKSIFAIRCLTEGNSQNQEFVSKMKVAPEVQHLTSDRFVELNS